MVWFLFRVQEVPGSIPGSPLFTITTSEEINIKQVTPQKRWGWRWCRPPHCYLTPSNAHKPAWLRHYRPTLTSPTYSMAQSTAVPTGCWWTTTPRQRPAGWTYHACPNGYGLSRVQLLLPLPSKRCLRTNGSSLTLEGLNKHGSTLIGEPDPQWTNRLPVLVSEGMHSSSCL